MRPDVTVIVATYDRPDMLGTELHLSLIHI